jgi:hypothetical protein
LDFLENFNVFGNISGVLGFFFVLWEKVAYLGHSGSPGNFGSLEDF